MSKVIMVQGTMSGVGKSLLVAGICRCLYEDGIKAAPFKSQNMALNSFITEEGLEMGRAQVVQAEAAGVRPIVEMNPILLKPTSDVGSQVIVHGTSIGTMPAKDYFAYKKSLIPEILASYQTLAKQFDVIVIEGAGSPAEINLKNDDIVNMGMASLVDAPVLLVGDIDRGGVFAQLYGTVALLEEEERKRIKGLIVNKFRGDKTILDPGIAMLEEKCKIPVAGVIPYLNVDLEDEDSLSEKLTAKGEKGAIEIAVIRFKRISNFTDFDVFLHMGDVCLRYVESVRELGRPDFIILPGTKNTSQDLLEIRQNGLEVAILHLAAEGVPIYGVCGGYQMLGTEISDENGVENALMVRGMGLLPGKTVFMEEKKREQVRGTFVCQDGFFACLNGKKFTGYEIHMGRTMISEGERPLLCKAVGREKYPESEIHADGDSAAKKEFHIDEEIYTEDGCVRGNVCGSYVHGVFDAPGVAGALVSALAKRKGIRIDMEGNADYASYKESQYRLLGAGIRESGLMEHVYHILEEWHAS